MREASNLATSSKDEYGAVVSRHLGQDSPDTAASIGHFAQEFWRRTPPQLRGARELAADAQLTREAFALWSEAGQTPTDSGVQWHHHAESNCSRVLVRHPDMPFLTDSLVLVFTESDLSFDYLHNVILPAKADAAHSQSLIAIETTLLEPAMAAELTTEIEQVLQEVRDCVGDYGPMKSKLTELRQRYVGLGSAEAEEACAFIDWLASDHFTFLGYRNFDWTDGFIEQVPDSALGTLRRRRPSTRRAIAGLRQEAQDFLLEPTLLSFSKAGTKSRIHRPAYPDYVGFKRFNEAGEVIGEDGFLGLYTSPVYTERPDRIPVVRQRVERTLERSGFLPRSFDHKALQQVLATYPRDELFQCAEDELFQNATAIAHIHERRETKVFLDRGRYGMFYNCLVYLPRDALHTRVRTEITELLRQRLGALDVEYTPYFSESVLVRLQYIIRVDPEASIDVDVGKIEQAIIKLAPDWSGELKRALRSTTLSAGALAQPQEFRDAFPASYTERFDVSTAVFDVGHLLRLEDDSSLILRFYRSRGASAQQVNLKVFKIGDALPLSQLVPVLEHLGFDVLSEQPYRLATEKHCYNIQDFTLASHSEVNLEAVGPIFEDAFRNIWHGAAESDPLNGLVVSEQLTWREVALLRSYARFMKQAGFGIEQSFIAQTLLKHQSAARLLMQCFTERLDVEAFPGTAAADFASYLDTVELINEDQVLRHLFELIDATVRSSFFRPDLDEHNTIAHKIAAREVAALPEPKPLFEIFVYAPNLEGVHLRSSRIARGGIRWSDRLEDFRTEVLGLVKAQIVKNAVIVPSGAKGGFVLKTSPAGLSRDRWQQLGEQGYRQFIRALLSVTDNLVDGKLAPPAHVARLDGDDPYLVVAADKGTATFSDTANEIATSAGFWLGDAFASGGSIGYDHKKLGITARGAWISVQRHFRNLGVDPQRDVIRTIGIGDMAGDVFGNGMLRSRSIALVAAFNHLHIFVDPNPDTEAAFAERERLFRLPRSGWSDYDANLISAGGGVFLRSQKAIPISPQMRDAFSISADSLSPDALLRALLVAPVDLIWNGGIGTYVKATEESNESVGDRANDALRQNGRDLNARVIGEGGNLGLTHNGRIEFAERGGLINADFIDNAGGVDCSDHEVNLKILLSGAVGRGELAPEARNAMLLAQADRVAELVLDNNFLQARCLAVAARHCQGRVDEYNRLALALEEELDFQRSEANFPDEETLNERARAGAALTQPELSTLLGYVKILLKQQLAGAELELDPIISSVAERAFPEALVARFPNDLAEHRLLADIVRTEVANEVVGIAGITFVNRVMEFVGCSAGEVVRAYWIVAELFELRERMRWFDAVPADPAEREAGMLALMRFVRRATRWLVRRNRSTLETRTLIERYRRPVNELLKEPEQLFLSTSQAAAYGQRRDTLNPGPKTVPSVALGFEMFGALAVADAAATADVPVTRAGPVYRELGEALGLDQLHEHLVALEVPSHWRAMERDALLDDLCTEQLTLTNSVLAMESTVGNWLQTHQDFVRRWQHILDELDLQRDVEFAAVAMTIRKLMDLSSSG
ncbi:MAG: NAD-glutamate dehydrogenase [Pseudomonadota bacterium]